MDRDLMEIGKLTLKEYLHKQNPRGERHPSEAYQSDLKSMNSDLKSTGFLADDRDILVLEHDGGYVLERDAEVLAVLTADGTLYMGRFTKLPKFLQVMSGPRVLPTLAVTRKQEVKYPQDYVHLVSDVAARMRQRYPVSGGRPKIQGVVYEVRYEREPTKNAGVTIIMLNDVGERVAMASNEWGATLIQTVAEYRGMGLGPFLGRLWYEHNPEFSSGGYTRAGEQNAVRIWESVVRDLMAGGQYTKWVKDGTLTSKQVKAIQAGLPARKVHTPKEAPAPSKPMLYVQDDVAFCLYDPKFLEDEGNDKYILGHGFLRDSSGDTFYYALDYKRPYRELVVKIALQLAKDAGYEKILTGRKPGDIVDITGIEQAQTDGEYTWLTGDVINIKALAAKERLVRKPRDPYQQIEHSLLETAQYMDW